MSSQTIYKLIVQQGPKSGEEFELTANAIIIGREADADIQIQAPAISRNHAKLSRRPQGYWIEDLGSSNGTFVNGIRLEDRVPLKSGDRIGHKMPR